MYCTSCGAENDDGARFCKSCGKAIAKPAPGARRFEPEPAEATGPPPHVPNYLVQAILVTVFCCLPFGIVSIVYAAQVNGKLEAGDIAGARQASANARTWAWVSFGVWLASVALYGFGIAVLGLWSW
jgi:hypothetical protein